MPTTLEDVINDVAAAARRQLDAEAAAQREAEEAMRSAGSLLHQILVARVMTLTGRKDLRHVVSDAPDSPQANSNDLLDAVLMLGSPGVPRILGARFRAPEGTQYIARVTVDGLPKWRNEPEVELTLDLGKKCCRRPVTMPVRDAVTHLAALEARQHVLTHDELPTTSPIHICRNSIVNSF